MLSKLACGINKPNQQTVLPFDGVHDLFKKTKLNKMSVSFYNNVIALECIPNSATFAICFSSSLHIADVSKWWVMYW